MPEEGLSRKILATAYRILSRRDHSREELREKLVRREFSSSEIEAALARLENQGYLNDSELAKNLVRHYQKFRRMGLAAIRSHLFRKGISEEAIGEALAEYSSGAEETNLEHLIERRLEAGDSREKLVRKLMRRGYSAGNIFKALSKIQTDNSK